MKNCEGNETFAVGMFVFREAIAYKITLRGRGGPFGSTVQDIRCRYVQNMVDTGTISFLYISAVIGEYG